MLIPLWPRTSASSSLVQSQMWIEYRKRLEDHARRKQKRDKSEPEKEIKAVEEIIKTVRVDENEHVLDTVYTLELQNRLFRFITATQNLLALQAKIQRLEKELAEMEQIALTRALVEEAEARRRAIARLILEMQREEEEFMMLLLLN